MLCRITLCDPERFSRYFDSHTECGSRPSLFSCVVIWILNAWSHYNCWFCHAYLAVFTITYWRSRFFLWWIESEFVLNFFAVTRTCVRHVGLVDRVAKLQQTNDSTMTSAQDTAIYRTLIIIGSNSILRWQGSHPLEPSWAVRHNKKRKSLGGSWSKKVVWMVVYWLCQENGMRQILPFRPSSDESAFRFFWCFVHWEEQSLFFFLVVSFWKVEGKKKKLGRAVSGIVASWSAKSPGNVCVISRRDRVTSAWPCGSITISHRQIQANT